MSLGSHPLCDIKAGDQQATAVEAGASSKLERPRIRLAHVLLCAFNRYSISIYTVYRARLSMALFSSGPSSPSHGSSFAHTISPPLSLSLSLSLSVSLTHTLIVQQRYIRVLYLLLFCFASTTSEEFKDLITNSNSDQLRGYCIVGYTPSPAALLHLFFYSRIYEHQSTVNWTVIFFGRKLKKFCNFLNVLQSKFLLTFWYNNRLDS